MVLSREEAADVLRRCPEVEAWLVENDALVHIAGRAKPEGPSL